MAQAALFASGQNPLGTPRRIHLGDGAWLDHAPGWLGEHQELFEHLRQHVRWREAERQMADRVVVVPRLLAGLPEDGAIPPPLAHARTLLEARYARALDRVTCALYRDGRDSVAWHADRIHGQPDDIVVAIVSLGEPRRFLLRDPRGTTHRFLCGWGDLLVMGGTCQRTCRHAVPKCAAAGPRMAIMFRHGMP